MYKCRDSECCWAGYENANPKCPASLSKMGIKAGDKIQVGCSPSGAGWVLNIVEVLCHSEAKVSYICCDCDANDDEDCNENCGETITSVFFLQYDYPKKGLWYVEDLMWGACP